MPKKESGNKFGGRGWPVIAEKDSDTKNSVLSEIEKTDPTHDLTIVRRTDGTDTKIANKAVKVATAENSRQAPGKLTPHRRHHLKVGTHYARDMRGNIFPRIIFELLC